MYHRCTSLRIHVSQTFFSPWKDKWAFWCQEISPIWARCSAIIVMLTKWIRLFSSYAILKSCVGIKHSGCSTLNRLQVNKYTIRIQFTLLVEYTMSISMFSFKWLPSFLSSKGQLAVASEIFLEIVQKRDFPEFLTMYLNLEHTFLSANH